MFWFQIIYVCILSQFFSGAMLVLWSNNIFFNWKVNFEVGRYCNFVGDFGLSFCVKVDCLTKVWWNYCNKVFAISTEGIYIPVHKLFLPTPFNCEVPKYPLIIAKEKIAGSLFRVGRFVVQKKSHLWLKIIWRHLYFHFRPQTTFCHHFARLLNEGLM